MELRIKNRIIDAPIDEILKEVREETHYQYMKYIGPVIGDNCKITCPFHKDGQERRPSCQVYANEDDPRTYYGTVHCFTCGKQVPLYTLVGHCFGEDDEFGKQWLYDRFGNVFVNKQYELEEILLHPRSDDTNVYLDESELDKYAFYHPYMRQRKITEQVASVFKVGYDKEENAITFPCWDWSGGLVAINRRCVDKKQFRLASGINKAVYLLNFIRQWNINTVIVCESQINALTCWGYGLPAIALMGTGSSEQYEILRKSGIRNYILCLDGDEAGRKGTQKFIKNMNKDVLITDIRMPITKDVNDLTKEEFFDILYKNDVNIEHLQDIVYNIQ